MDQRFEASVYKRAIADAKIVSGQRKKEQQSNQANAYAATIAGSLKTMTEPERLAVLNNIKGEAPDLYEKIMGIYGREEQ